MRTFCIQTLGCKVNQYESEQIATLLRARGLIQTDPSHAELRVINSCSVTVQAASKSRQTARRATRLPVLNSFPFTQDDSCGGNSPPSQTPRVILTGCWATSDKIEASRLPGVDAVVGHHDDVAAELNRLLDLWEQEHAIASCTSDASESPPPKPLWNDGSINQAGTSAAELSDNHTAPPPVPVKQKSRGIGTHALPQLNLRQASHQRAFLKVQDGCDAHCTYCIIPQLRSTVWSKPIADTCDEAHRLVDAGHVEIVLTGIFLGAYGHPTALRRRQDDSDTTLVKLVEALCTRVRGLRRLRLSSLEPGDLTGELIAVLRAHQQCVPHFHLPLQSGSDLLLKRMNRQYTRDDFLRMIDAVHDAFDRPAITTDIIVGFPGETDAEFQRTSEVVDRVRFMHIHAFSYSPRPKTAAARWTREAILGGIVNARINELNERSRRFNRAFRESFLNEQAEILIERPNGPVRHGRAERYFDVHLEEGAPDAGELVRVRISRITPQRTWGVALCT